MSEAIYPGSGKAQVGTYRMDALGDYMASLPKACLSVTGVPSHHRVLPGAPFFGGGISVCNYAQLHSTENHWGSYCETSKRNGGIEEGIRR